MPDRLQLGQIREGVNREGYARQEPIGAASGDPHRGTMYGRKEVRPDRDGRNQRRTFSCSSHMAMLPFRKKGENRPKMIRATIRKLIPVAQTPRRDLER